MAAGDAAAGAEKGPTRVVVVSGANTGIGLEIVRGLSAAAAEHGLEVVLGARDEAKGKAAADSLAEDGLPRPTVLQMDITDEASVAACSKWIGERTAKGDAYLWCLINNAGFAFHGDVFGAEEADTTLGVNVRGTMRLTRALLPALLASSDAGLAPRVINVCSQAGRLDQVSAALQDRLRDKDLDDAGVLKLGDEFVAAIRAGDAHRAHEGWSDSMYGVSKLLELAWTFAIARELSGKVFVNAVCPGWCSTAMSSFKGPRSAEKGAETPIWLALADLGSWGGHSTGGFFKDKHAIAW